MCNEFVCDCPACLEKGRTWENRFAMEEHKRMTQEPFPPLFPVKEDKEEKEDED